MIAYMVYRQVLRLYNGGPDVTRPLSRHRFPIRLPFPRLYPYNIYAVLYYNIIAVLREQAARVFLHTYVIGTGTCIMYIVLQCILLSILYSIYC